MDGVRDLCRVLKHIYYLDEDDYVYMSSALTTSFNWMIPTFIGGWMFKRLYLIEKPNPSRSIRISLRVLPYICPIIGWNVMYLIYYRNDNHIQEIFYKYPAGTDFSVRKKINPFELGKKNR